MIINHKYLIFFLVILCSMGGVYEKCKAQQTIFLLNFGSQNLDDSLQYLTRKIPRSLEIEINQHPKFHTLKRDTSKKSERTFQFEFEPLSFDTLILNKLRSKYNIDIIVFGEITQSCDSLFIATKSFEFKNYIPLDSCQFMVTVDSLDNFFENQIAEFVSSFSQNILHAIARMMDDQFTILFAPFPINEQDSLSKMKTDSTIDRIVDTLSISFQQYNFECLVMDSDTNRIDSQTKAQSIGKNLGVNLVVWWDNIAIEEDRTDFQPALFMNDSVDLNILEGTTSNVLLSAMGQLSHVMLNQQSTTNFYALLNFVTGYIFLDKNQLENAIKFLKKAATNDLSANYYLGDAYLRLGRDTPLANAHWDTAIHYYQKCLKGTTDHQILVWVFNNLGVANQLLGNLDKAYDYFEKSLNKKKESEIDKSIIRIYNNLGNVCLFKGEWTEALQIFKSSIHTMEQLGDKQNLAITYDNMGDIYQLIMQRLNAIKYYEKSLSLRQEMGDDLGVAISYGKLGDVYLDKKEYPKAHEFYKQELKINERLRNEPRIAHCYDKFGYVLQVEGKVDSALIYFQKGLELFELVGKAEGIISTANHLAALLFKHGDLEKALELYERCKSLAEAEEDEYTLAQVYDNIANIYNNQQRWDESLDYYEKSARLHEKLGYYESHALLLFNMGLIHLKKENYHAGYHLMKRAIDIDEKYGFFNLKNEKEFVREIRSMIGIQNH